LHEVRLPRALEYARLNGLNTIVRSGPDDRIGVVAAGKTYLDLREALSVLGIGEIELERYGIRLLKLGMIWPAEPEIVGRFAAGLDQVIVVEEKRAFVETSVKEVLYGRAQAPAVLGKRDADGSGLFATAGELDADAVAAKLHVTYKLLYNSAVAMTGGQSPAGGQPLASLVRLLQAEGVAKVAVTTDDPSRTRGQSLPRGTQVRHRDDLLAVQRELAAVPGVTVMIHDQECAAGKRRKRRRGKAATPEAKVVINERICEGCGDCGEKSNCLSVHPVETEFGRKTRIHHGGRHRRPGGAGAGPDGAGAEGRRRRLGPDDLGRPGRAGLQAG
jgi:TPP-dependent indolepyruvate ferredoxin oxidoreductase alpha subunit